MPPRSFSPLSLPPLTTLLFLLQALVILGAGAASLLPGSQLGWGLILLPLVLLPLRDFLHWPEREARRYHLRPASEAETPVRAMIEDLSRQAGIHPPQLLVGQTPTPLYTFGAFRRTFIALGAPWAGWFVEQAASSDPAKQRTVRTMLAHELAHFANHDMQRAGLAGSLLKMTALYALFALWTSLMLVSILIDVGPEITREQFWIDLARTMPIPRLDLRWIPQMLQAQNPKVWELLADPTSSAAWGYALFYLANVFIPFVLAVPILYLFFWRKLVRVREFYADAYAASLIGAAAAVQDAMALHQTLALLTPPPTERLARLRRTLLAPVAWLSSLRILSYHPTPSERAHALMQPLSILGRPWQIAAWTGVAILLLEIMLRSSLTFSYIMQPGPYLPLLTASLVFSLWMLPHVCVGAPLRSLLRTGAILTGVFLIVKLSLNFLDAIFVLAASLLGRLGAVGAILDAYLRSQLGLAGASTGPLVGQDFDWPQIVNWHIVRPIAYFAIFGALQLVLFLVIDAWLRQRVLTWYGLGARVKRVFWLQLGMLLLIEALVLIPLANRLYFPMIYAEISGWFLAGMVFALALLIVTCILFISYHRRLSGRCPRCQDHAGGPFVTAMKCPHCDAILHPWLLATYA